jgi:hypothetical protein
MRRKILCDVCKRKYFGLGGEVNEALTTPPVPAHALSSRSGLTKSLEARLLSQMDGRLDLTKHVIQRLRFS